MEGPQSIASSAGEVAPMPRPERRLPLVRLAGMFFRLTAHRAQLLAALLSVAASLTEGVGLALLAPLLAMLGAAGPIGPASRRLADVLGAVGLPLSLPVLVALFVGLVAGRAVVVRGRDVMLTALNLDFINTLRRRL